MKKFVQRNALIRRVLALWLVVAFFSVVVLPTYSLANEVKASPLKRPEKVFVGNVDAMQTEKGFSDYYSVESAGGNDVYTRKSTDAVTGSAKWKRGVALLYGENYKDFTLDLDCQFTSDISGEQRFWIVFGETEKGKFDAASGSMALTFGINKYENNASCSINYINSSSDVLGTVSNFDATKKHHYTIISIDGVVSVSVDGGKTYVKELSNIYNGGYLGIGTGQKSVQLSNIIIANGVDTGSGGDDSSAFYGEIRGAKSSVDGSRYYTIEENNGVKSYKRNSWLITSNWMGKMPFISLGKYTNFVMEYDFRFTGSNDGYIWLNIGNEDNTSFDRTKGAIALAIGVKNIASDDTIINGYIESEAHTGWFDADSAGWSDTNKYGSRIVGSAPHHAKITVDNRNLTIDIDNGGCLKKCTISDSYIGGYLLIGSCTENTVFSGVSVMDSDVSGNYQFYFTDDLNKNKKATVTMGGYYNISGGSFCRNETNAGTQNKNVALFGSEIYYTDFNSSFSVNYSKLKTEDAYSWISIGNLNSYSSFDDLVTSGAALLGIKYRKYDNQKSISVYNSIADTWDSEIQIDSIIEESIKFEMSVKDRNLNIKLNDKTITQITLPNIYAGGLVFFGTSYSGVAFENVKINSTADVKGMFDSYFSTGLSKKENLDQVDFDKYWSVEGAAITRKAVETSDSHTDNMAVLYYNLRKYNNFEMTLRYRSTGARGAYFGLGAEKGKSWWTDKKNPAERSWEIDPGNNVIYLLKSGVLETGPIKSYIEGSNADTWWYDSFMTQAGTLFTTSAEINSYHTLRVRMENGTMTVWVDDMAQGSLKVAAYKEGYLYIAASLAGSSFTVPIVTDYDNEPKYDFSEYKSYFGADLKAGGYVPCDANDYWRINSNGNIERRSMTNVNTTDYNEMAALFLKERKYKDFVLEFDYKHGTTGWGRFFVGFGAQDGKSWYEKDGGITTTLQVQGIMEYDGNVYNNGKYGTSIFWGILDDDGNKHQQIPNYNRSAWHHMYLEVAAGNCTVRIDDYVWDYDLTLPNDFEDGYIFFAANSAAAEFRNIKVTDLSELYPEDTSTGWQPTEEDVYFDFSKKYINKQDLYDYKISKIIK